jgi:hypothetical protein
MAPFSAHSAAKMKEMSAGQNLRPDLGPISQVMLDHELAGVDPGRCRVAQSDLHVEARHRHLQDDSAGYDPARR